jgi:hypothetical protein
VDERQVQVSLTDAGRALLVQCDCLGETLLAKSAMTLEQLDALNRQVQGCARRWWTVRGLHPSRPLFQDRPETIVIPDPGERWAQIQDAGWAELRRKSRIRLRARPG